MTSQFRAAGPGDREPIARLLVQALPSTRQHPNLSPSQMQWKYEDPAEHAWTCRNYVIARDGEILAHAGVWPVRRLVGTGALPGAHLIDWAATSVAAGAGLSLLQRIGRMAKVIYGLGGSDMTRRIFPAFGFRPIAQIGYYALPLRPLRQVLSHQYFWSWKTPARLARNTWWARRAQRIATGDWSAAETSPRDNTAWPAPLPNAAVFARDAAGFEYLARCPVMRTRFCTVRQGNSPAGYFLLAFVPGQARIADAWTPSEDPAAWEKLFALAAREALREPDACELTTIAGISAACAALMAGGFHQIKQEELLAYDPQRLLPAAPSVHFQLVDNDASFLHDGTPQYMT